MTIGNPLLQLAQQGQAVWLDFIDRELVTSGRLSRLVKEDSLRGVTSNPTIFEAAIARSHQYDADVRAALRRDHALDARGLYEAIAIRDIQLAADVVHPVYERTRGRDGFVCLEASPFLAHDTRGTLDEARRLHALVDRPNVMIKVPGTPEGVPAVEQLVAEGLPVNVTLLFSVEQYEAVAQAYARGVRRAAQSTRAASVASLFVSRIDTYVDRALDAVGSRAARGLRGWAGIAVARVVYERFLRLCRDEGFVTGNVAGVPAQRVLWASTSTKDPAYRDVRYVEELVGSATIDTMPLKTLEAFRDHGQVRGQTASQGVEDAHAVLAGLAEAGVRIETVALDLQREGVEKFSASFESLLAALDAKKREVMARL